MPEEHAKLSASGSKKWINCPASIAMESKFPDVYNILIENREIYYEN